MKPQLYLFLLENIPIFEQLQFEEALLRSDKRNILLLNRGSPPAIVMGISGKEEQLVNFQTWEESPIPLLRRFSGGGTVVIDENTFFVTLIVRPGVLSFSATPRSIMDWSASLYRPLLKDHPFALRENDYVMGDLKWGGNAQSITKEGWLHHTSILWDFDPEKMHYLKMPLKVPLYRGQRKHSDFLCRMKDFVPSQEHLTEGILSSLRQTFEIVSSEMKELTEIVSRPHRRATVELRAGSHVRDHS